MKQNIVWGAVCACIALLAGNLRFAATPSSSIDMETASSAQRKRHLIEFVMIARPKSAAGMATEPQVVTLERADAIWELTRRVYSDKDWVIGSGVFDRLQDSCTLTFGSREVLSADQPDLAPRRSWHYEGFGLLVKEQKAGVSLRIQSGDHLTMDVRITSIAIPSVEFQWRPVGLESRGFRHGITSQMVATKSSVTSFDIECIENSSACVIGPFDCNASFTGLVGGEAEAYLFLAPHEDALPMCTRAAKPR